MEEEAAVKEKECSKDHGQNQSKKGHAIVKEDCT
jgi:hypothetical protein